MRQTIKDKVFTREVLSITGFEAAGLPVGLKKSGKPDLALIHSTQDCALAAVFTTNRVKAAPVLFDMERLNRDAHHIRAVISNSGHANACTGQVGLQNARRTAEMTAQILGCQPEQVLVLSTGVIGEQIPIDVLGAGIPEMKAALKTDGWLDAAEAIMTTDTVPKAYSKSHDGYTITGIAKGSGMIAPNMATMLSVVVTDAAISPSLLQQALQMANSKSFNSISVDGDTSTNDTVLLLANGASGVQITEGEMFNTFVRELTEVCAHLARMIVVDGEGATKFITIDVTGAVEAASAQQIARTIANSPLVKTAFYGSDANWGRIMMAAGRAGVEFDQTRLGLWFGAGGSAENGLQVVANGTPTQYAEEQAMAIFQEPELALRLDLGMGTASATVWTCDLSHEYVTINADYRT